MIRTVLGITPLLSCFRFGAALKRAAVERWFASGWFFRGRL
jgi:hypothetical protein